MSRRALCCGGRGFEEAYYRHIRGAKHAKSGGLVGGGGVGGGGGGSESFETFAGG